MSRTSWFPHPVDEPLILIHRWQLEFCTDETGKVNECAAALLSFLEYWHGLKLRMVENHRSANDASEHEGKGRPLPESTLQWHSTEELERGLLIFKRSSIQKAIDFLQAKGVLSVHRNPALKYDHTRHFQFRPEPLFDWLKVHRPNSAHRSAENSQSQENTPQNPPSVWDQLKTADRSAENSVPSAENSRTIPETTTETSKTTTTARENEPSPAQKTESSSPSFVDELKEEEPTGELALAERQQLETLAAEFGLSVKQAAQVTVHAKRKGMGYVLGQADIVRAEPRKNAAGAFVAALRDGWRPRKKLARKVGHRKAQEQPVQTQTASVRAPEVSAELAHWQQASPEQRSAWLADPAFALMRMPKEGLAPSRLFLQILGFVLGSREGHCSA